MSDEIRWRYGDTNPVFAAVDSTTVIEVGDLVWQCADNARPASTLAEPPEEVVESGDIVGVLLPLQERFAAKFLGVAMQGSRENGNLPIRVATTGVFEFDCPSGTFELGDFVGADENGAGDALLDQQVAKVSSSRYAIGRVAKREDSPATSVLVDVRSTVMTGGVEGSSPSGV